MRQAFTVVEQNLVSLVNYHVVVLTHLSFQLAVCRIHNQLQVDT